MADETEISAGGKTYKLYAGVAALVQIERETGMGVQDFFNRQPDEWKVTEVVTILRAALARHHPKLTELEVADIADELGLKAATLHVCKLVMTRFGEAENG